MPDCFCPPDIPLGQWRAIHPCCIASQVVSRRKRPVSGMGRWKGLEGAQERWGPLCFLPFLLPFTNPQLSQQRLGKIWGRESATLQPGTATLSQKDFRISYDKIKRIYNQDLSFPIEFDPRDVLKLRHICVSGMNLLCLSHIVFLSWLP